MSNNPNCNACKCDACQRERRRALQHIIDAGGPEAFNVLMETSTSDAERRDLMAQAQAIVEVGEYVFSWKGMMHTLAIAFICATLLAWGTGKISLPDVDLHNKTGYDYDYYFR